MRTCTKCKKEKELSEFYFLDKGKRPMAECKVCRREFARNLFAKKSDAITLRVRLLRQKQGTAEMVRRKKAQDMKFPEKARARRICREAKRYGKIKVGVCEKCGEVKVDAHHTDYSKPLDVMWLCRKHHMKLHRIKEF